MIKPTTEQHRHRLGRFTSSALNKDLKEYKYRIANRSSRSMLYVGLVFADKVDVTLAKSIIEERKAK